MLGVKMVDPLTSMAMEQSEFQIFLCLSMHGDLAELCSFFLPNLPILEFIASYPCNIRMICQYDHCV
jgi:hypothetical protein